MKLSLYPDMELPVSLNMTKEDAESLSRVIVEALASMGKLSHIDVLNAYNVVGLLGKISN